MGAIIRNISLSLKIVNNSFTTLFLWSILLAPGLVFSSSGANPYLEELYPWTLEADSLLELELREEVEKYLLSKRQGFLASDQIPDLVVCLNLLASLYDLEDLEKKSEVVTEALWQGLESLSPDHPVLGMTYQKKGELFLAGSQLDSAMHWFEKAAHLLEETEQWENFGWSTYFQAAVYYHKGAYLKVEPILTGVLEMAEEHLQADHVLKTQCFQLLGIVADAMGDYEQSLGLAMKVRDYRLGLPQLSRQDSIFLSDDLNNLGTVLARKGGLKEAMDHYEQSLRLRRKLFPENHISISQSLSNIGDAKKEAGAHREAIEWFHKSLDHIGLPQDHMQAQYYIATCQNLSTSFRAIHRFHDAKMVARKAIDCAERFSISPRLSIYALGDSYLQEGKPDSALLFLEEVQRLNLEEYGAIRGRIRAWSESSIGAAYLALNKVDSALIFLQSSLYHLSSHFSDSTGISNPSAKDLVSRKLAVKILLAKADALNRRARAGDLEIGLESLELAFELTNGLRQSYLAEGSKQFISQKIKEIAELGIDVCYDLHQEFPKRAYLERAYSFAEKSRAILLLGAISTAEAHLFTEVPNILLKERRRIEKDLSFYTLQLSTAQAERKTDNVRQQVWKDKIFALSRTKEKWTAYTKLNYPEYYAYCYQLEVATLKKLQVNLDRDESILEYFRGQKNLYCFAISKGSVSLLRKPIPDGFEKDYQDFCRSISDYDFFTQSPRKAWNSYTTSASSLYALLLPGGDLEGAVQTKQVTIIPDEELYFIPFAALLTDSIASNARVDYLRLPYLLRKCAIRYAWSGSLLLNMDGRKEPEGGQSCLAIAPGASDLLAQGEIAQLRFERENLPGTQQEIRSIAKHLEGDYWIGAEASKANFVESAQEYDVLHLAMHGVADFENPMASRLIFSEEGRGEDLLAWEIAGLELSAELVVLSACETGQGKLIRGEGVMSLARSFVQAGAASVVTTLWKIDDVSSAELMEGFYQRIAEGKSKDAALQEAQLAFLGTADSRTAHPFYWAGFVMTGDKSPLKSDSPMDWSLIIGTALMFFLCILIFIRKRG